MVVSSLVIYFEESASGNPSLFPARVEYLFAFQFWHCELVLKNNGGRVKGRRPYFAIFVFSDALIVHWWGVVNWGKKFY